MTDKETMTEDEVIEGLSSFSVQTNIILLLVVFSFGLTFGHTLPYFGMPALIASGMFATKIDLYFKFQKKFKQKRDPIEQSNI